jgi:integrase
VDVGAGLGLRQGEALGLRVEDVDWLRRVVHVRQQVRLVGGKLVLSPPKGGKERDVPLPETVGLRLAEHLGKTPQVATVSPGESRSSGEFSPRLIFTSATGGLVHRNSLNDCWRRAVAAAGLPHAGFHMLRHHYISYLISVGVDVVTVAACAGDTVQTILRYYAHLMPSADDKVRAAIDRAMDRAPGVRAAR